LTVPEHCYTTSPPSSHDVDTDLALLHYVTFIESFVISSK
jgi:hypothetical protein